MSDIFERNQQQNFFTPERQQNTAPVDDDNIFLQWHNKEKERLEYKEKLRYSHGGASLSMREFDYLYDLKEKDLITDDDVYKFASSRDMAEYFRGIGIECDPLMIYNNYDEIWKTISDDREERYASAKSRWEAVNDSIQIAKNMEPMGRMGLELQGLHNQLQLVIDKEKREELQKQADDLWKEIEILRAANAELGKRFPKDALTTIATSTIQSAPYTGKSIAAGAGAGLVAGGVAAAFTGGAGFVPGFKIGYGLGSFAASSADMAGMMYIDLLAAGVEQKNAAGLAILGGGISGLIESSLGVVAGFGGSAVKAIGGRVISQEAQKKIAEAASKNFIKQVSNSVMSSAVGKSAITRTIFDTAKETAGEGLEEGLQFLVEHAMLAMGDAMQDDPVDRNLWGSAEFQAELKQSIIGGLAGGIGFGIFSLPLNITGNVRETARQTEALKNLAIAIDDKAEFKAAAGELPITKHFNDKHFDEVFDSQESERQKYNAEMREEAERAGHHQWASMPTLEAPGEMRRRQNGRLSMRITSPEGEGTGTAVLYDPPTKQRMGSIEFDWDIDNNTVTIENIELSQAITDREKVIGDMIKELSYNNPEMSIEWNPDDKASAAAGVDLAALKNNLIAENPRGEDWSLQFYQKGDRFNQSRAMNEDIDLIASSANVSREIASDTYEAWNIAFKNFGLDTHEMIEKMGLTSEKDLRLAAANDPQGVETQVTRLLDQGRIAAQKVGQTPTAGTVVIKQSKDGSPARILSGREALNETIDQLRAITVLTEKANPSTLHHEWLHFMVNVVIPNSQRYRTLLEEAVGKKLEDFDESDHEWLAENYERYLRTGEAPTSGLKALFKRIAEALRQFVKSIDVSPKLREFFDQMLAGTDGAMLKNESHQAQESDTKSRARVQTDNEQQKAFAEMTTAERILQSDLHSAEEKAEILFQIIGEQGAAALDKAEEATIRMDNLNIARQMEEAKKDAMVIRAATGWERGADGKWRYEIPDIEINEDGLKRINKTGLVSLKDLVIADNLFKAYPDINEKNVSHIGQARSLKNYSVLKEYKNRFDGVFRRSNKTIEIAAYYLENNIEQVKNVLIHEIQHAIQEIEGFAEGGSPENQSPIDIKKQLLEKIRDAESKAYSEIPGYLKNDARRIMLGKDTDGSSLKRIQADPTANAVWAEVIKAEQDYEYEKANALTAKERYNRLAGEVEARNAQIRSSMSEARRAYIMLEATEDVSREDQIFIESGLQTAQMAAGDHLKAIHDQYHNADGTAKAGWLKAPNGKDTNLTERQWMQVRTPAFKNWFGDWEAREILHKLEQKTRIAIERPTEEINTLLDKYKNKTEGWKNSIIDWAKTIIPDVIKDPEGKDVEVSRSSIRSIISHGRGPLKLLTLPKLEEMLSQGVLYHKEAQEDKQGRRECFYNYAYPIHFENKNYIISMTVKEDFNGKRVYDNEFVQEIKITGELSNDPDPSTRGSLTHPSALNILKNIISVNEKNVSKVIDENGEPMPVFRGDKAGLDIFNNRQGVFHATSKKVAEKYSSGGLYDLFLDIKNPYIHTASTFLEIRKQINDFLYDIYDKDLSELENNEQFQTLRKNYLEFRNEEGSAVRDFYNDFLPEVSEDTDLEEFKDILSKSLQDVNREIVTTHQFEQLDYHELDILSPFIKTLGYDGIIRPYDHLGRAEGNEYITFNPTQIKSATDNIGTFDPQNPSILFQLAFHGSPYRFERFDSAHMGSGEGAQAYGWGHYFAGKKEVAEWYHKNLSKKTITEPVTQIINGKRMGQWIDHWKNLAETANSKDKNMYLSAANMLKHFGSSYLWDRQEALKSAKASGTSQKAIDLFDEIAKEVKRPGQLYEVDIPGDEKMLDWDKKLSEQPEVISKIIKDNIQEIFNIKKENQNNLYTGSVKSTLSGKYYNAESIEELTEKIFEKTDGADLYFNLVKSLGNSKSASEYLSSIGIKGNRYLDGPSRSKGEGTYNYVVFDDNEINITNMLFQMTRDEIYAQALSYSSWEAWMKGDILGEAASFGYNEAAFRRDNATEEPQSKKEKEEWYKKQWNEAQVLAREAALGDDGIRIPANAESINPELLSESYDSYEYGNLDWLTEQYEEEINQTENVPKNTEIVSKTDENNKIVPKITENNDEPITTSEANRRLIVKLPAVIDDYVLIMGNTLRDNLAHFGAATEEDTAAREQIEHDKNRIYKEVHPYIRGLALGMTTGKKLSDKQRRTAISHISRSLESGATVYRELYTSLTEDEEFVNYSNNEIQDEGVLGEAQKAAAEAKGLTAFQRTRLAENIIDKDIARKIRAGAASSGEIANYIKRRNEEISELDNEIKKINEELKKSHGETEEERNEVETWRKAYHEIRKELQAAKKEAEQLQIKLERAKQVQKNAAQRAKDGREKSEAKLKEQLKAKREEIKKLNKSIKEKIAYAKKHGKLEKAWQLAEQRQKVAKKAAEKKQKAADRKAAQKYLEANKKLAAWIMSADRVGMKVWVRQRELILGLQNALFQTSKRAAYARQKDREIKEVERDIEKLRKQLKREKEESKKNELSKQIDETEAFLENLKSERNNIEILGPYLAGMEIGANWEGVDTMDTGTIVYNGATLSVEEFRKLFYERKIRYGFLDSKLRRALQKSAPKAFKGKYSEKIQNGEIDIPESLGEKRKWSAVNLASEMSLEDLLAIKAVIQQLNKEGRANWERREFATKYHQKELTKTLLFNLDELEEEGETLQIKRYIKAMEEKNIEERKHLLSKGSKFEQTMFTTFDEKRLLQWMDGNRKGALYKLIIRERIRYANRRDVAIDQRTKRIMEIIGKGDAEQQEAEKNLPERLRNKKIRERALKRIKELGNKNIKIEGVGPGRALRKWEFDGNFKLKEAQTLFENSTEIDVSLADLMFLAVALDNKFARAHYLFGNLWSDDERAYYEKFLNKNGTMPENVLKEIEAIGREKEDALRKAIKEHLFEDDGNGGRKAKNDLMQIVDAIRDDFESHFAETRAVYQDMFNQSVEGQDNYLPIIITEGKHAQAEKQSEIEALTQGSYQVKISPDKGMNLARVDIGPTHQTEIESDIFKVYFKGVEREEHFNKFAPYVRDINTVLRGRNTGSKQLAQKLTDVYGKWAVDRLYQHVNMIGLPPSAKLGNAWESAAGLGKVLAGNAGVAFIAYNIPAWLAQYPNSIAAFFGKADARFILSSCLELMKPGNDLVERVFEKSPKVKQRVISVAEEYREHLAKQPGKLKEAHAKFVEIGMMGQRHADQTMVAAGWWALYQTALKEGKSEEDAVVYADEITSETQPDLNALETSQMYKDQGLGGLFLRFSQPLNVIWQNLTYDSFISREKSFKTVVPRLVAYGLAALTVAAMRGALADKDDEELDKEELMRKVFYYMVFSNFSESVPLIGNAFAGTMERVITGEGIVYQGRYFELAERILNIPKRIEKENFEGAFEDAFRALGLGVGLPISQINRIRKAIREESPLIIFGFDPN